MTTLINISHKIELIANNKAKTHFRKAFGCARLAYNWGLARWQECYKQGIKTSRFQLQKEFNAIKKDKFPFVYEVSKYATQQPFKNLDLAYQKFFRDLKKGKVSYPKFKSKRDNFGSFYIGGDQIVLSDINKNSKRIKNQVSKKQYLKIPNLGYVKLTQRLRFQGKINSVVISQQGDKYYASFSMQISLDAYKRTHKTTNTSKAVGIDLGLNSFITLSNGMQIKAPKPLKKLSRKLVRKQRQLNKKQHAKTKDDVLKKVKKSNNYKKQSLKVNKLHKKIANIRNDFLHKTTSMLVRNFKYIAIEDLNVSGMVKNHKLAKAISDVSFCEFRRMLQYKADHNQAEITIADRFYPSSKTCSCCGLIKQDLTLKDRLYCCESCDTKLDRDYNASLNLLSLIKIGQVMSKFTPVEITAMLRDCNSNLLATSIVETGNQQKICNL